MKSANVSCFFRQKNHLHQLSKLFPRLQGWASTLVDNWARHRSAGVERSSDLQRFRRTFLGFFCLFWKRSVLRGQSGTSGSWPKGFGRQTEQRLWRSLCWTPWCELFAKVTWSDTRYDDGNVDYNGRGDWRFGHMLGGVLKNTCEHPCYPVWRFRENTLEKMGKVCNLQPQYIHQDGCHQKIDAPKII